MESYAIQTYKDVLIGSRKRFPTNFWKDDENKNFSDAADITRYLIEDVLHWDDETVKNQLCCKTFFDNSLKGMLWTLFNDSVFAAIQTMGAFMHTEKFLEFRHSKTSYYMAFQRTPKMG